MNHKLAYILNRFPHGHTSIVNELRTLAEAGIDVNIIALRKAEPSEPIRVAHKTDYPVTYLFESKGGLKWLRFLKDNFYCMVKYPVTYGQAAARSVRWYGANFKLSASFARILELVKPTLVYVNWSWATCGSVMYACRILQLPFIFSVRGTDITPPAHNFPLRVSTAQRILTPCPVYVELLKNELRVPADKIRLVPNCIASKAFETVKPPRAQIRQQLRLLYVSTLRPVKRHEDLIHACAILRQKGMNFECRIFGEGPIRNQLQGLIDQLGLSDSVSLAGHVPQEKLPGQFEWSDIYVHPSEREGLAHAILEAQASARPVVLADGAGGIRDSIIPGETAIMVPVGQPQELAAAVIQLANDPELRFQMGQAGREYVTQTFSIEKIKSIFLKALLE